MPKSIARRSVDQAQRRDRFGLTHALLIIPVVLIAAFAFAGQPGLTMGAVSSTLIMAIMLPRMAQAQSVNDTASDLAGRIDRPALIAEAERRMGQSMFPLAALTIEIDRFKTHTERFGHEHLEALLNQCADRLTSTLQPDDFVAPLDGPAFSVLVGPDDSLDLEASIQVATRIQSALAEPFTVDGSSVRITVSIGFSISNRLSVPTAEMLFQASMTAMIEAQRSGPSAIRSFSEAMQKRIDLRRGLVNDVQDAFSCNQISAYFQPQVSTQTNEISGFETLARWHHPTRGPVPPNEFLPAFQDAGVMNQLCDFMVEQALGALRQWQDQGFFIPRVGVNFSSIELSNPDLVERIKSRLAQFDISADRLGIEVLETVVANQVNGIVIDNLSTLAEMGCGIDLDDFGTGHASITSIRRFSIERIKIDRSFVTGIDDDPEQQNMVAAILTMADRLGLDALAEGVETQSEEAMLARLGCRHVQGFGVAYPMPLHETLGWIAAHSARQTFPTPLSNTAS